MRSKNSIGLSRPELDETGITVNVLVPGEPTDTALIADGSDWPKEQLLKPEVMGPPACWLIRDRIGWLAPQ